MPFTKGHKINIGNKYASLHGMAKTPIWRIYFRMRERCNYKNKDNYHLYGGRGIKCQWESFQDFYEDMNESYLKHINKYGRENTTIDRIDVNGNYCKENCRWATVKEQSRNKRNNIFYVYRGERLTISQWAERFGITRAGMRYRLLKMPLSKALTLNTE